MSFVEKLRRGSVGGPIFDMGSYVAYTYLSESDEENLLSTIPSSGGSTLTSLEFQTGESISLEEASDSLTEAIWAEIRSLNLFFYIDSYVDFGQLALECCLQLRVVEKDVMNALFDVAEFASLLRLWQSLADSTFWSDLTDLARSVIRRGGSIGAFSRVSKKLVDQYLGTKYGVFPSIGDAESLMQGLSRLAELPMYQRLHSRTTLSSNYPGAQSATHTAVLTAVVGAYPNDLLGYVQEVIAGYKRYGAWPEVYHLWDRLVFSFVIDWFIQFGNCFEDISNYLNVKHYFPVEYCILSEKWEMTKLATDLVPDIPVTGVISFSYYVRWITREVPLPPVAITAESSVGNHSLEALALVLQRVKG
jgi:hypothetical protein